MKHKTLEEMVEVAQVVPVAPEDPRALRRQRLESFAKLLEGYNGRIRLLSMIEYVPENQRLLLRRDESPLAIAYQDAEFRRQGLNGDRLGDAIEYFDLSMREAHHLLCDCNYTGTITPRAITPDMVAQRARSLANKKSFREIFDQARRAIASIWR